MSETIDKTNFLDLKSCDPEIVTARTGCRYDKIKGQYFVNIWGNTYCVDLNQYEVKPQGDEDFPSEARLLFDRTIQQHLPLDIIYALAVEVCHTLG